MSKHSIFSTPFPAFCNSQPRNVMRNSSVITLHVATPLAMSHHNGGGSRRSAAKAGTCSRLGITMPAVMAVRHATHKIQLMELLFQVEKDSAPLGLWNYLHRSTVILARHPAAAAVTSEDFVVKFHCSSCPWHTRRNMLDLSEAFGREINRVIERVPLPMAVNVLRSESSAVIVEGMSTF
ncbi:hypothetical protein BC826DRAFT_1169229 [Russula brevipes]|nr:hypothetical protein BC826DRAFT_1169229 [Russula brevipes]